MKFEFLLFSSDQGELRFSTPSEVGVLKEDFRQRGVLKHSKILHGLSREVIFCPQYLSSIGLGTLEVLKTHIGKIENFGGNCE